MRTPARAVATWVLIALTVGIYAVQLMAAETQASELVLRYGLTPQILLGGERPFGGSPPLLTLLTALFLHGSWDHLVGNMIYLWAFGDDVERVLGPVRFVLLYLLSGVCGALGYVVHDPHAAVTLIGATGCVSGVIAATLVLKPCEPLTVLRTPLRLRIAMHWAVGSWILLQLFQFLWHSEEETFSTLAQAGGAIGGALAFWLLAPRGTRLFQCIHDPDDAEARAPD